MRRFHPLILAISAAIWSGFLYSSVARAQEPSEDYGEIGVVTEYAADRESHLAPFGAVDSYLGFKQGLQDRTGLAYTVEYAPILQWGAGEFHANHELNLIGFWNAIRKEGSAGSLLTWFQHSETLGELSTSAFMDSLGVISPINGGDTGPVKSGNRWQLLAWEQHLAGDRWRLMAGKITSRVTFNLNRYAVSDREDFFSPMLVNNPVAQYTARVGLGLYARYQTDAGSVAAMVRDASATEEFIDFDSLSDDSWEYLIELEVTPEVEGLGDGHYRLTYHDSAPINADTFQQPATWSLSVSADQNLGDTTGAFFRFAYADTPLRTFRRRLAAGAQLLRPLGFEDDRLGVAAWWGDPTDSDLRSEWGLEAFWRFQIGRLFEVSPDVQFVFNPATDLDQSMRPVFGLRGRMLL